MNTKKILIQNLFTEIYTKDSQECENKNTLYNFIDDLILELNMTIIKDTEVLTLPYPEGYQDKNGRLTQPDDFGLTSLTAIAESHIATHSFTKNNLIYLEISSCKHFNTKNVTDLIHKFYPNSKVKHFHKTRYLQSQSFIQRILNFFKKEK